MYSHILVPLDGSHLAEQVLPHAKELATLCHTGHITLLRAVPPIYPVTEYGGAFLAPIDEMSAAHTEAQEYLERIAREIASDQYEVSIEISNIPAAEAVVEFAEEHDVKIIMIATHGRSGISRWIFGSVTQKVIQGSPVPVMVVRPVEDDEHEEGEKGHNDSANQS